MTRYQCGTCQCVEVIEVFVPEQCSSCGGRLYAANHGSNVELGEELEVRGVVSNDPQTWIEAVWSILDMAREDCISEDGNGPNDLAWDDVCTAMAWISEALNVETNDDVARADLDAVTSQVKQSDFHPR